MENRVESGRKRINLLGYVPLPGMVGTPRGPMFRNSGGVGPPPRAVMFREFADFT